MLFVVNGKFYTDVTAFPRVRVVGWKILYCGKQAADVLVLVDRSYVVKRHDRAVCMARMYVCLDVRTYVRTYVRK